MREEERPLTTQKTILRIVGGKEATRNPGSALKRWRSLSLSDTVLRTWVLERAFFIETKRRTSGMMGTKQGPDWTSWIFSQTSQFSYNINLIAETQGQNKTSITYSDHRHAFWVLSG